MINNCVTCCEYNNSITSIIELKKLSFIKVFKVTHLASRKLDFELSFTQLPSFSIIAIALKALKVEDRLIYLLCIYPATYLYHMYLSYLTSHLLLQYIYLSKVQNVFYSIECIMILIHKMNLLEGWSRRKNLI